MDLTVTQLDILQTKAAWPAGDFKPAYVATRGVGDNRVWHVATSPIPTGAATDGADAIIWAVADGDEYVRIPLFSYHIIPQGDLALAFMFQLGLICANSIGKEISALYVVTGDPVELIYSADGKPVNMRYWFGFAAAFKE